MDHGYWSFSTNHFVLGKNSIPRIHGKEKVHFRDDTEREFSKIKKLQNMQFFYYSIL